MWKTARNFSATFPIFLRNFCHIFSATFGFFERNFLWGLINELYCLYASANKAVNINDLCMCQLINEPWAGDVYTKPSLLLPGVAGRDNLQRLYDHLSEAIRSVDENTLIFYEPVTWSVFLTKQQGSTGFTSVPGGPQSVISECFFVLIIVTRT